MEIQERKREKIKEEQSKQTMTPHNFTVCICNKGQCYQSVYLTKKNPLLDGRGGQQLDLNEAGNVLQADLI